MRSKSPDPDIEDFVWQQLDRQQKNLIANYGVYVIYDDEGQFHYYEYSLVKIMRRPDLMVRLKIRRPGQRD